jgi:hypothetical protein
MHFHSRRLRGGGALVAALAANYSFVALYNDSTIGHILRVVSWLTVPNPIGNVTAYFVQGTVGSLVSRGVALFSGEQDMAGQIWSGQNTVVPPFGIILNANVNPAFAPAYAPWWHVRPGYSLVAGPPTVNIAVSVSFWWEDLEMSMIRPGEME